MNVDLFLDNIYASIDIVYVQLYTLERSYDLKFSVGVDRP